MTEEKIAEALDSKPTDEVQAILYLKNNYHIGIAYGFMPVYVQEWACNNSRDIIYYNRFGWGDYPIDIEKYIPTDVIALPPNYEPARKEQQSGEWIEFEIKKGKFNFIPSDVNGLDGVIESWWNWQEFLTVSSKFDLGFTAFGGWQYESNGYWLTQPHVMGKEGLLTTLTDYDEDCKPAIPTKIRFWRETK